MKKKTWIIIGVAFGLPLVAIFGVFALGALFLASAKELPVTEADKDLIVDAFEFVPYYEDFAPDAKYEGWEKLRYVGGTVDLTYEYDSPLEDEPYIRSTVTWDVSRSDANLTYALGWSSSILGLNIADEEFDVQERDDYYAAGDRSRIGLILYDGEEVGNLFVVGVGDTVLDFTISGFVMNDPGLWHELFDDIVSKLE